MEQTRLASSLRQNAPTIFPLLIGILGVAFVVWLNMVLGGTIATRSELDEELNPLVQGGTRITLSDVSPFKYRILFRFMVDALAAVSPKPNDPDTFYRAWLAASVLCFLAAALMLYALLRAVGFSRWWALAGLVAWLISPPILMAWLFPVHTREDMLAYFLLHLGLWALVARSVPVLFLATVLGVMTREPLLVLPIAAWWASDLRLDRKLILWAGGAVTFIAIRILLGGGHHRYFGGLTFNLAHPFESLLAIFLAFGVLWFPAAVYLVGSPRLVIASFINSLRPGYLALVGRIPLPQVDGRLSPLLSSFVPVAVAIGAAHLILGRLREIRISFLLAVWLIAWTLSHIRMAAESRGRDGDDLARLLMFSGAGIGLMMGLAAYSLPATVTLNWRFGAFKESHWVVVLAGHMVLGLGLLYLLRTLKKSQGSVPAGVKAS